MTERLKDFYMSKWKRGERVTRLPFSSLPSVRPPPRRCYELAGASDVIQCFLKELAILQANLKAEEVRAVEAETAKVRRDNEEVGLSVLWVTKTALEVTRKRLANEREAKKVLQLEVREAQNRYKALAERAASKEHEIEEKLARLQAALDERTEELWITKQDLRAARQETAIVHLELAKVKSLSNEHELKAAEATSAHHGLIRNLNVRDAELELVCEELAQVHNQMVVRDEELNKTRKKLRLALRNASNARSIAVVTYARHKMARRDRKVAKRGAQNQTCRELIGIVETLEAAAATAMKMDGHSHVDGDCKYQKKYIRLKVRNSELEMSLAEMNKVDADNLRSRKRKRKARDENGNENER
ncbi:hypothetical protein MVEN_02387700 [Mycena venus]|uniref:Uncharacterized protein n=1 Tax=Mycena venus TaxID=2733690 RepID=A0A8H7CCS2_9AGAR|nr:hypothetical protein MVEN_02387700 [Mycena venus]